MGSHDGEVPERFWLFAGYRYYAKGGMHDYRGAFATCEAAVAIGEQCRAANPPFIWYHVSDSVTWTIVAGTAVQAYGAEDLPLV